MPDFGSQRSAFRKLHESGCFVMPNPWDAGTTTVLRQLGFPALATTSAGFAFSRGLPDRADVHAPDDVLAHVAAIVEAAGPLPVNADLQSGYAPTTEGLSAFVQRGLRTGIAGFSIEDASGDRARPLFEVAEAAVRVRAARAAIDASRTGVLLTARAECFLVGHPEPLPESIRRLQAYAEAGADVLFAPGVRTKEDIARLVAAVAPKPLNVLVGSNTGLRVADLAELGVRRVSVGSAFARVAWTSFLRAARELAGSGSFAGLEGAASFAEMNALFA